MTREEAIFCEKSYIGETNCTDCNYYGTDTCKSRESHKMAIKALEQEPTTKNDLAVEKTDMIDKSNFSQEQYKTDLQSAYDCGKSVLDKIRAEIAEIQLIGYATVDGKREIASRAVLQIIDKYKSESEEV